MTFDRRRCALFRFGRGILLVNAAVLLSSVALAQGAKPSDTEPWSADSPKTEQVSEREPQTILSHSDRSRWWLSGQINFIPQGHGDFPALYSGPNSLNPKSEIRASRIFTLYTAARLTKFSDIVFDAEEASGNGISNSLGLAGYTNIDVVRVPGQGTPLSIAPYMARAIFRYVFPLSRETEEAEPGPLGVLRSLPLRRLEFRAGNFALADLFDVNEVGSDSHLQFMNWTVVNNGAWHLAADTRGYTYGAMLEYDDRSWAIRFAEALMPTVANGSALDGDLRRARGENLELELHPNLIAKKPAEVRLLSYVNHANMGDYREAVDLFQEGKTSRPLIEATRQQGRAKYGFGINLEQQLSANLRAFGRFGWNHQEYLKLGGLGFLLGDGTLAYGRGNILEGYYNAHLWRGIYGALDLQHVANPAYNRDRGPVFVPALRLHIEL